MNDKATYNQPAPDNAYILESKKLDLHAGVVGKFFGAKENAPINIAGLFVMLLLISGVASLFIACSIQSSEYWKIIAPLMTMALGYVFGRSSKDS